MHRPHTPALLLRALFILLFGLGLAAADASASRAAPQRIRTLVLTGENRTDWRWTSTHLRELLESSGRFDVEISVAPEAALVDPDYLARFQLLLIDYSGSRWGDLAEGSFLEAVRGGVGVVALADAVAAFEDWPAYEELVGWKLGEYAYKSNFQPVDFRVTAPEHPIFADYAELGARQDQLAVGLELVESEHHRVVATVWPVDGSSEPQPAIITGRYGEGRVVSTPLGHVSPQRRQTWESQRNPEAEKLLLRACEWAGSGTVTTNLTRLAPNTLGEAERAEGWVLLFDGGTTRGWESSEGVGFSRERWRVEGGALRVLPEGSDGGWFSAEEFQEFELELEWRVEGESSSTIGFTRGDEAAGRGFDLDDSPGGDARRILRPEGEFNHARIVATYGRVEHWLNGVHLETRYMDPAQWAQRVGEDQVAGDAELSQMPLAKVLLESEGAAVWFRNIKIRHLPQEEASPPSGPQTIELFNGRDLTGWEWVPDARGPRNAPVPFAVGGEGQLVADSLPLGELRTTATYKDLLLELDYRFDPTSRATGEGGIYLRRTGEDVRLPNAVEVELDHMEAGSLWRYGDVEWQADRRRVYGDRIRPIQLNENRAGEWNHLEIRLERGDLLVTLNEQVVNNAQGVTEQDGTIALTVKRVGLEYRRLRLTPLR